MHFTPLKMTHAEAMAAMRGVLGDSVGCRASRIWRRMRPVERAHLLVLALPGINSRYETEFRMNKSVNKGYSFKPLQACDVRGGARHDDFSKLEPWKREAVKDAINETYAMFRPYGFMIDGALV